MVVLCYLHLTRARRGFEGVLLLPIGVDFVRIYVKEKRLVCRRDHPSRASCHVGKNPCIVWLRSAAHGRVEASVRYVTVLPSAA